MQLSKLVDRKVDFEILCPDWANEILDQGEFSSLKADTLKHRNGHDLRLSNADRCIVGEAHA